MGSLRSLDLIRSQLNFDVSLPANNIVSERTAEKKAIRDRIGSIEDALIRARAYLETGAHADWHGFRALFVQKLRDGKELPPHKDWVRNVFLPRMEKALRQSERALERISRASSSRPADSSYPAEGA